MQKLSILLLSFITLASASTLSIKLPEVPKPTADIPKVVITYPNQSYKTNEEILQEFEKKPVFFSNHVAPKRVEKKDAAGKITLVGDVKDGLITAYLHAPLITMSEVKEKLTEAGFEILSSYKIDKKGAVESVVFTNADIIKNASKKNRGFSSSLRVTIDKKNELVSITNPLYIMTAFMQDEYDAKLANETLVKLRNTFKDLKNSTETSKFRVLPRYQFMAGMPRYHDMQVIKKGVSAELLASARKSKKIVYEQALLNGSVILGVKLSKRTSKFVKKTGYQNAGLLPYPVLIENGEVKILDPKYYIAIMYPKLKMSQFMKIATVPGAIGKDIDRIFR